MIVGASLFVKISHPLIERPLKLKLSASLQRDYSRISREWPYKDVPHRIIAEEYLSELGSNEILDYKMYCFHGKPKLTVVCSNRFSKTGTRMNFTISIGILWAFILAIIRRYQLSLQGLKHMKKC